MRILVTGAGGFIGHRIVTLARERGFDVTATARSASADAVAVDVTDRSTFGAVRAAGGYDSVVHCAGITHRFSGLAEDDYFRVNVGGTRNIAELASECGAKRLVILSSVLVYGRHGVGISEVEECSPGDPYAKSKLDSERAAIEIGLKQDVAVTVLRPAPVIGEGCKGNFARLIRAVERGRFVNVGDGSARKSMVYVGDVADSCLRAIGATPSDAPKIFNIAGETVTTGEILAEINRALEKNKSFISIPARPVSLVLSGLSRLTNHPTLRSAARSVETWTSDDVYSSAAIRDALGFVAETPFSEVVRRTVASYKAQTAV